LRFIHGLGLAALASLGRCHQRSVFAVRREHAMETGEVDPSHWTSQWERGKVVG